MDADGATWPAAYVRVIDGIGCPAYCCSSDGALVHCNRSARRLWGSGWTPDEAGCWDGFAALYRPDGAPVDKSSSPAAVAAASGVAPPPAEFLAGSGDWQRRCLVIHGHPVLHADGTIAGVLCSLTDVSERQRLDAEVRFARDNREAFLRVLAHELRNPLASVMMAAAVLRQPGVQETVRMARMIERQTRQLARFIGDLLDGARIEHACDIAVAMRTSSVGNVLELARDVAVLRCDPERLAQALGNVLLNASEFSDDGAEIALAVAIDGALLEVQVTDRGIGVEAAQLHAMFEPFRKLAAHPARMR